MKGQYKFELLGYYPHLAEKEIPIWERFMQKNPGFFESVDYDVVCGSGHDLPDDLAEPWQRNAKYLGKYKIDVVGYKGGVHYIVEVRPSAGPSSIGSTLSYAVLYQSERNNEIESEPIILTDVERPDMRALCDEHDIGYIIV
jgi:hypothetical protein